MANIEKTLLLFDWDDVLFNAADFKNDYTDSLEELNISPAVVFETYQEAKRLENGYDFDGHATLLVSAYPDQAEKIRAVFARSMSRVPGFVFADAKHLVITAGLKGAALGIATAGNEQFQAEKIKRSGLELQFNFIKIIPADKAGENKAKIIAEKAGEYERIVFFEDSIDNLNEVARLLVENKRLSLVYVNRDGHVHQLPPGTTQVATLDSAIISKLCFE
ncbi:MAG: HAD family hydrolase [bacterium]|nr:HAD family hydrolase [bacterium]